MTEPALVSSRASAPAPRSSRYNAMSNPPPSFRKLFDRLERSGDRSWTKNALRGMAQSVDREYTTPGRADDLWRFLLNTEVMIDVGGRWYYYPERAASIRTSCLAGGAPPPVDPTLRETFERSISLASKQAPAAGAEPEESPPDGEDPFLKERSFLLLSTDEAAEISTPAEIESEIARLRMLDEEVALETDVFRRALLGQVEAYRSALKILEERERQKRRDELASRLNAAREEEAHAVDALDAARAKAEAAAARRAKLEAALQEN